MKRLNLRQWVNNNKVLLWGILLIFLTSGISYLPYVFSFNFRGDDWHYILDGYNAGPSVYHYMFSIDRPARGYIFEWLFRLFYINPLPYQLLAYTWRFLSGMAALYLFNLLWPKNTKATITAALLFTLYPGYLWWPNAVEYQPMIMSVFFQTLSIALTVQALVFHNLAQWKKTLIITASILSGWIYVSLVDYAIGMELLRLVCIVLVVLREQKAKSLFYKAKKSFSTWIIYSLIPIGFIFWKLFLFNDIRPGTNITTQLQVLLHSPITNGAWWIVKLFQSAINVIVMAWNTTFYGNLNALRLMDLIKALGLAGLCALVTVIYALMIKDGKDQTEETALNTTWQIEAILLGIMGGVGGVVPVIMMNRVVDFENFSHYALPPSLAAALFVMGILYLLNSRSVKVGLLASLVFMASFTHVALAIHTNIEEAAINELWWQVSWRVPQIREGTSLLVNYKVPTSDKAINISFPAELIYFPTPKTEIPIHYKLAEITDWDPEINKIIAGGMGGTRQYRAFVQTVNYDQVMVITQPQLSSCVHVMTKDWEQFSLADSSRFVQAGPYSDPQNILLDQPARVPPSNVFGPEPPHNWCYYYQQAELALQQKDWTKIIQLQHEAEKLGYRPGDIVEWMPFILADAYVGDEDTVQGLSTIIRGQPFIKQQVCHNFSNAEKMGIVYKPNIIELTQELFCY
jgi:hypothetical protein